MTAPSTTSARMLRSVCETSVPSTIGKRSRTRPTPPRHDQRPRRLAEPGRQGGRHQHADHRRARGVAPAHARAGQGGAQDRVPGLGADQHRGAHEREGHEHPDRRGGHDGAADRLDADPLQRERGEPGAGHGAADDQHAPGGARDLAAAGGRGPSARATAAAAGRTRGPGSVGTAPSALRDARRAAVRLGHAERLLVDRLDLARPRSATRSARRARARPRPSAARRSGSDASSSSASPSATASPTGTSTPSRPSRTTSR